MASRAYRMGLRKGTAPSEVRRERRIREVLLAEYERCESVSALADRLGLTKNQLYCRVRQLGLSRRPRALGLDAEDMPLIEALLAEGVPLAEVAEKFEVSEPGLARLIRAEQAC